MPVEQTETVNWVLHQAGYDLGPYSQFGHYTNFKRFGIFDKKKFEMKGEWTSTCEDGKKAIYFTVYDIETRDKIVKLFEDWKYHKLEVKLHWTSPTK